MNNILDNTDNIDNIDNIDNTDNIDNIDNTDNSLENLSNAKLYKKIITNNANDIINSFIQIIKIYFKTLESNKPKDSNKSQYFEYLFKRGIYIICIVYYYIYHKTYNLELTHYHTEKAIYYYSEFLSQLLNEHNFLTLTCQDAIMFVYKKTIYKINKKNNTNNGIENKNILVANNKILKKINSNIKIITSMLINLNISIENIDKAYNQMKSSKDLSLFYEKIMHMNRDDLNNTNIITVLKNMII